MYDVCFVAVENLVENLRILQFTVVEASLGKQQYPHPVFQLRIKISKIASVSGLQANLQALSYEGSPTGAT